MKKAAAIWSVIITKALLSVIALTCVWFSSGPLLALSIPLTGGGGGGGSLSISSVSTKVSSASTSVSGAARVSSAPASVSSAPISVSSAPATVSSAPLSVSSAPASVSSASVSSATLPVNLGTAGPQSWSVLEIGTSQVIGLSTGGPTAGIAGNVGINQNGGLQLTNTSVQGNLVLGTGASQTMSGTSTISGSVTTNQTTMTQALRDAYGAWNAANLLAASGGGIGITSINATSSMTLQPGVYDLNSFNIANGAQITLAAGGSYVFNISGGLTVNGANALSLAMGLSYSDVLFNIMGTSAVQFLGGGNAAMLYGIILSPYASINIAPGNVIGEIIGGVQINMVSNSAPTAPVPDNGSSIVLLSLGLAGLLALRCQRFFAL